MVAVLKIKKLLLENEKTPSVCILSLGVWNKSAREREMMKR